MHASQKADQQIGTSTYLPSSSCNSAQQLAASSSK